VGQHTWGPEGSGPLPSVIFLAWYFQAGMLQMKSRNPKIQTIHIDNQKNLLSSNMSSTCPHNMANFGLLAAEIGLPVWGTHPNFNGLRILAALLHSTAVK